MKHQVSVRPGRTGCNGTSEGRFYPRWIFTGMLILSCFLFNLFFNLSAVAQAVNAPWVWMHGDNEGQKNGVYGTQGISSPLNKPGSRTLSAGWATPDGNLWLFGGYGNNSTATGRLNDLWKYNISSGEWTWVKGDDATEVRGFYGPPAVGSASTRPGARSKFAAWTDRDGGLWLFGGFGKAVSNTTALPLNDLWRYNPATNRWVWMHGDSVAARPGEYGVKGVPAPNNRPGSRSNSAYWTDNQGNFWLFGGQGYGSNPATTGQLNDLWKFNVATGRWIWVSGDSVVDQWGVYGVQGIANASNRPGARGLASGWADQSGNFWLFGGEYQSAYFNDLWKYDPVNDEWTWIKGDNTTGSNGVYGTKGVASAANTPGARNSAAVWTDQYGDFWMLGGHGFPALGNDGFMNDLWRYKPSSNEWTWVSGDSILNEVGVYGTIRIPDPSNKPGARDFSAYWTDHRGELWLFGGDGYGASGRPSVLNDLWKLQNCINLAQPAGISGPDSVCAGTTQVYYVTQVDGATSYAWTLPQGWTGNSTADSIVVISGNANGTISVNALNLCDTGMQQIIQVAVYPLPDVRIRVNGKVLGTTASYASYQWYRDGRAMDRETDSVYTVLANGDYMVKVTNRNGCVDSSDVYSVRNVSVQSQEDIRGDVRIYPNPASGEVYIQTALEVNITLLGPDGRVVLRRHSAGAMDIGSLPAGLYLVRVTDTGGRLLHMEKLVKRE